ncbi:MAG: chromate transporter, partial [Alphaproteobacteria bacterium]
LPGPEAQQLATYVGWLMHRTAGGLAAGTLFVLPGFLVMLALSALYAQFRDLSVMQALFFGVKAAVLAVVIEAVVRIGRRVLKNPAMVALASAAFVAIFFFEVPFPVIVLAAGAIGLAGGRLAPATFAVIRGHEAGAAAALPARTGLARALLVFLLWATLWLAPVAALVLVLGPGHVFAEEGVFFSKMAVVTFGGAYAVLAYVAQEAVNSFGWLAPGEMLDGLGLAETTPGPLILVLEFVGFLAAFRDPGALDPLVAGLLGATITTWVTFTPCFLWILLGAPYVERLRGRRVLDAGLSAVTAAVVGVVLNLALWFLIHVLFGEVDEQRLLGMRLLVPEWATVDWVALALAALSLLAMLRFKVGMIPTLALSAALGALYRLALA